MIRVTLAPGALAVGSAFRDIHLARDFDLRDAAIFSNSAISEGRLIPVSPKHRSPPPITSDSDSAGDMELSHERFQLVARATQDLIWDWDVEGRRVTWAGTTQPYFGASPEELASRPGDGYRMWAERVHPDDLQATEAASRTAFASGAESWEHEYRFGRADGSWAHVLERALIVRAPDRRVARVIGAMQDVSGQRSSEAATAHLAAIVASSEDAIVGKTLDGIVTSWNAAAERIFGYRESEMVGRPIFTLIPPELHQEERDLLERIRRGERVGFSDTVRVHKDGRRISIALTVSPIRDSAGVVIGASSIKRDITARKEAARELARREQRYHALITAISSVVWTADPEGRFVEPQLSWRHYTGQPWEEHRDFGWAQGFHPDDRETIRAAWCRLQDGVTLREAQGRLWSAAHQAWRHALIRAAPVLAPDGTLSEWIGTVTDVEDHWITEERLRQTERMESVGRLAGGIAHEANNQMTVILGTAEFLGRLPLEPAQREDLGHIRRAAERTAAITQQLLAFSRRQVLQPQPVDLNASIASLKPIIERALGETSRLVLRLAPDLGRVQADPGQLDQVLLNLILNARDAMPAGGMLHIETSPVHLDESFGAHKQVQTIRPGPYALLVVSDTGSGMDRKTLDHVFEPFFTTKAVGEGTGLGLATVYGIVKQSGGFIWAYSEPGHGTAFKIYLPAVEAAEGAPDQARGWEPGDGVVLVVEDELTVRTIMARALRECGYTVLEAGDGLEALEVAGRASTPPDLVIADVVMPRMGGKLLAARLWQDRPGLPVLFTSGYTGLDAVSRGLLEESREFMQKPLQPEALVRRVREIMEQTRGSRSPEQGAAEEG